MKSPAEPQNVNESNGCFPDIHVFRFSPLYLPSFFPSSSKLTLLKI